MANKQTRAAKERVAPKPPPSPCYASDRDISDWAGTIAEALGLRPGGDLMPIVKRLKGTVERLPLNCDADTKQASITVEKGGKFTVRLFPFMFPMQERLSIAHELGHLFLHSQYGKVEIEAFHGTGGWDDVAEDEASTFAEAFLMPTKDILRMMETWGDDSMTMAMEFDVPEPLARQRIADVAQQRTAS